MANQQQPQDFIVHCDSERGTRELWAHELTAEDAAAYVVDVFNIPILGRWVKVTKVVKHVHPSGRSNAALFEGIL